MSRKNCAIIAEPPMCFEWGYDEEDQRCCAMKLLLLNRITRLRVSGITDYYVPLGSGICLYTAEILIPLMEADPKLRLHCIIPYEDQANKWSPNLRDRYYDTLERCSDSAPVSLHFTPTCELDARLEAVDLVSIILAVRSETIPRDVVFATALRYAEKMRKETLVLTAQGL